MGVVRPFSLPSAKLAAGAGRLDSLLSRLDASVRHPRSARDAALWLTGWLVVAANWALWLDVMRLGGSPANYLPSIGAMLAPVFAGTLALLSLTAWSRWMKPLWLAIVVAAAFAQHYMLAYRIVLDPTMVANIWQTDVREARDLLSWRMAVNVLVVVVPAAWWLLRVRILPMPFWSQLWRNAVLLMLALLLGGGGMLATFKILAPLMRNNADLRYMLNPLAMIYSTGKVAFGSTHKQRALAVISGGAALGPAYAVQAKPPLFLLVVGETARADHFSLNGYARNTNPELSRDGVLSWSHSQSCGTSTAASVPCMFSPFGKTAFESRKTDSENLLDVLQASGLAVLWIDNQSGCKGACDRVTTVSTYNSKDPVPELCNGGECLDEIMLRGIDARIDALPEARRSKGIVVVMHQMGSHGPAYSKRSSEAAKRFKPECTNITLSQCSHEELVNAFDNSIVYTDHMLGQAIEWLKSRASVNDTAMLYVSDHGESLGENGIYLHGLPYMFAPAEQKHNAMIAWLSPGFAARTHAAPQCIALKLDDPVSHDNMYHTVLGAMDVISSTYLPSLDLLSSCRQAVIQPGYPGTGNTGGSPRRPPRKIVVQQGNRRERTG